MGHATSILIIDDDETIGLVLRRVLRAYDVCVARSTEEALACVSARPFDGILCDLTLPGESGVAFYRKVATLRPGQERRVRFMTGGPTDDDAIDLVDRLPNRVLHKPFELDRLRSFVAELVA